MTIEPNQLPPVDTSTDRTVGTVPITTTTTQPAQTVVVPGAEPPPVVGDSYGPKRGGAPGAGMTRGVGRMWASQTEALPLNIGRYSAQDALVRYEELDPSVADMRRAFSVA